MDILISEDLDSPAIRRLGEKYQLLRGAELWKDPPKLKQAIRNVRAILVRNQTRVTADVLEAGNKLVAIGRVGVGLDNIDVEAATKRNIVVIAPLKANATSVAELTIALMLALARKIAFADRSTKSGAWDRKGCTGIELDKKTLLICGFGRIGRMVAARARAFGLRIVVFAPSAQPDSPQIGEVGATLVPRLSDGLAVADFVSAHLPLTENTRDLFDEKLFAAMKRGAYFINTSRGGVVNETALLNALRASHLGGAALDVRQTEPPRERSAFEAMDNVILTPHIGAFTAEAQARTYEAVCDDIHRLFCGEPAVNAVNMPQPRTG